jgi:hypothetical protein
MPSAAGIDRGWMTEIPAGKPVIATTPCGIQVDGKLIRKHQEASDMIREDQEYHGTATATKKDDHHAH